MGLYLSLVVVGLCLWGNCIAICPDGLVSPLKCNPTRPFVCPEGYRCLSSPKGGQCCLEPGYTCPVLRPAGFGNLGGLARCGNLPGSGPCPFTHVCKAVEPTSTKIGICCPHF
ncbi:hypothetical protein CHS0354_003407 [Potamilus streckersoni]|uniref:Uncharacterized protein n=1 Tax=Potamilus streckersoni TaxID=2493646 RepID=A0AAE0SNW4_9BIVA|nr:hypothetical protein CHS0354_003407 [Potamilus streckersoni]